MAPPGRKTRSTFGPEFARAALPWRSVNRKGDAGYEPGLQRHHLLPQQLQSMKCFEALFECLGRPAIGFNDFRANGMLLPSTEQQALRRRMPLHRGPHNRYNEVVIASVGQIEGAWASSGNSDNDKRRAEALARIRLLQSALRRRLLNRPRSMLLSRYDPIGSGVDFSSLDAMAETIWNAD